MNSTTKVRKRQDVPANVHVNDLGSQLPWEVYSPKQPSSLNDHFKSLCGFLTQSPHQVEEAWLIHRNTGILLRHAGKKTDKDPVVVSGMLQAMEALLTGAFDDRTEGIQHFKSGDDRGPIDECKIQMPVDVEGHSHLDENQQREKDGVGRDPEDHQRRIVAQELESFAEAGKDRSAAVGMIFAGSITDQANDQDAQEISPAVEEEDLIHLPFGKGE